jgi:hypothetical protein
LIFNSDILHQFDEAIGSVGEIVEFSAFFVLYIKKNLIRKLKLSVVRAEKTCFKKRALV